MRGKSRVRVGWAVLLGQMNAYSRTSPRAEGDAAKNIAQPVHARNQAADDEHGGNGCEEAKHRFADSRASHAPAQLQHGCRKDAQREHRC